jgi:hypothetical protein
MNKPTGEAYLALYKAAEAKCVMMSTFDDEATSIAKDLVAHGWREAIEELRAYSQRGERIIHEAGAQQDAANHLESIAKERGYL